MLYLGVGRRGDSTVCECRGAGDAFAGRAGDAPAGRAGDVPAGRDVTRPQGGRSCVRSAGGDASAGREGTNPLCLRQAEQAAA